MKHIRLSEDEVQYIFDNVGKKSTREIAEWIGCNVSAVNYRLRKRGITHKGFSVWSPYKQDELLSLRRKGFSIKELAKHFDTTQVAIEGQIRIMRKKGIKVPYTMGRKNH